MQNLGSLLKPIALLSVVLFSLPSLGAEGFFPIDENLNEIAFKSFYSFPEKNDCGSVRIHQNKPYFLTALHCLRKSFDAKSEQSIGNQFNYDSLVFYGSLAGQTATIGKMKIRVLANGGCYTGFSLDVFAQANASEIKGGIECLSGDWLIFEVLKGNHPAECSAVEEFSNLGFDVSTVGGPRVEVKRNVGLSKLNGRVFSRGKTISLQDLLNRNNYPEPAKKLWNEIMKIGDPSKSIMITDSDIINGMSGGPVFKGKSIVAISTVGLLPNYIYDFGFVAMSEGYNFGIHGALPVHPIMKLHPQYFVCP